MKILRRVAHILNRSKRDTDLRDEMQFHLAMKQRELEAAGFTPEAARNAARKALGNVTYHREASHGVWVAPEIEGLWRDIPYALRSLRRTPSFTIAAVLALGLGTGSAAAVGRSGSPSRGRCSTSRRGTSASGSGAGFT